MRRLFGPCSRCVGTIMLVLGLTNAAYAQDGFEVTDLGTLDGVAGNADDINEAGQVDAPGRLDHTGM